MQNQVFCFGIIPLRKNSGKWEVLLVHHAKGHWGLPKGHPLPGESPEQTACREMLEETGLRVKNFFQMCPLIERYFFTEQKRVIEKTVTYFLAEVEGNIAIQYDELVECQWFSFEEAIQQITFTESKQVCKKAFLMLGLNSAL